MVAMSSTISLLIHKLVPISIVDNVLKIKVPMSVHINMLNGAYKVIFDKTLFTTSILGC